jgi:hypothetical protein
VKASVSTDIPLARLPELIRLAAAVDSRRTLTETFGVAYFARRRAADNFPLPDLASIQGAVREAILLPPQLLGEGRLESAAKSC